MHPLFLLSFRKNWASTWTVLQGSSLLFAKGQGSGTSWVCIHAWLQWSVHLGQMWNYSLNPVSQHYFNLHALNRIPHSLPQICLHLFRSVSCKLHPHSVLGNKCKQKEAYMLLSKNCCIQITINISSLADLYLSPSFISPMCCECDFMHHHSLFCSVPFFHLFSVSSKSYCRNGSFPELLLSLLSNWKRSIKPRPAVSYTHCRQRSRATSVCVSLSEQNECALDADPGTVLPRLQIFSLIIGYIFKNEWHLI